MKSLLRQSLVACAITLGIADSGLAYTLFGPYPWGEEATYYLKWGDIFTPGTSGGTITWSLMPDGTTIDPAFNNADFSGTSSLTSIINGLGHDPAMAAIQRAFDRWSASANIYFEQVTDSGVPFHSSAAVSPSTGAIRLGAFPINASIGAVGYAPPPNGGTLEGDVLLNANSTFFLDDGAEGESIDVLNDFESLLVHEIGHAIGLAHSDVCSVMSVDPNCYQFVNRIPDSDDVAGAQFLYGPPLAADFNRDNQVDADDLGAWRTGFGISVGATRGNGDADKDGDVDGNDLLQVQRELGRGATLPAQATPEPGLLAPVATAILAWAVKGRRRLAERGPVKNAQ